MNQLEKSRTTVACASVGFVGVLIGLGQAVLWAAIAPHERWIAYPDRDPLSLPTESTHRFTAIGMFALISVVIGIVLAVAAWQIRFARSWQMLATAGAGVAGGSCLALWWGPVLAGGQLPVNVHPVGQAVMVSMPPSISWTLVLVAPLFLLLTYAFLASWHPDPNLGHPNRESAVAHSGSAYPQFGDPAMASRRTAPIPIVVTGRSEAVTDSEPRPSIPPASRPGG